MSLRTSFTRVFGIEHPIAQAPMGGSAGGALAAAVSNAGGLGLVGGGRGNRDWLERELELVSTNTTAPWGVGFLCWAASVSALEQALAYEPAAVMLSFGDPGPFVEPIRESEARLIVQVVDLDEAERAVDVGADIIVAQGTESGGHGARKGRSTLSFVPVVVDLAGEVPVLAAGGISDGRGIAAALCLGASGALLGSRFQATHEALVDPLLTEAILSARGAQTERTSVPDILLDNGWPRHYTGRTLVDRFIDEWREREDELVSNAAMKEAYRVAMQRGEIPPVPVWISESVDLIRDTKPAAVVVRELAGQTERALNAAAGGESG